jgi:hypothetical protein
MGGFNGVMTLKLLIDSTTTLNRIPGGESCSGCSNSCQKMTTDDILKEAKLKKKCCKKYKKKKSYCNKCPKRSKGVA